MEYGLYLFQLGSLKKWQKDFPGGPMAKTCASSVDNTGSIPGWGTKNLCAVQYDQKKKERKKEIVSGMLQILGGPVWDPY